MYWIKYKFYIYIFKRSFKRDEFFFKFLLVYVIIINVKRNLIFFLMELYVNIILESFKYMYMLML